MAAAPRRRGPVALPPLPMVQLRVGGRDWPQRPLLAAGLETGKLHVRPVDGVVTYHDPAQTPHFPGRAGQARRVKWCESCNRFRDCPGTAWLALVGRSSCAEKMPLNKDFGCAWRV